MAGQRSAAAGERRLAAALSAIEARFGRGVVERLREVRPRYDTRTIPSGSLGLDLATGLGGLPRGQLTELLGTTSSGKTALLYAALAATQRQGGIAALIDAEGTADAEALRACGIDLDELLIAQPTSAADAFLLLAILARCGGLDALGLASVAALRDLPLATAPTSAAAEPRAYDLARLVARGLRVLMAGLRDGPTAIIVTNELLPHLPGYRSLGGLALRHYAALRVAVEPQELLWDIAGGVRALRVRLAIVKHKLGTPGGQAEVEVAVGQGIDRAGELLHLALAAGLIARDDLGFLYGEEPLGRSIAAARRRLLADPALAGALAAAIRAAHRRSTAA